MGVAVWLVWRRGNRVEAGSTKGRQACIVLRVFAVHFACNIAWLAVFFGLQSILGGLIVIGVLWLIIVGMIGLSVSSKDGLPYCCSRTLLGVSFAAHLNPSSGC
jgi:tryptophan-rich sensory protein